MCIQTIIYTHQRNVPTYSKYSTYRFWSLNVKKTQAKKSTFLASLAFQIFVFRENSQYDTVRGYTWMALKYFFIALEIETLWAYLSIFCLFLVVVWINNKNNYNPKEILSIIVKWRPHQNPLCSLGGASG